MVLGANEALVLAALETGENLILAQIGERLHRHFRENFIADGTIYVALQRMAKRGLVIASKTTITSADGRRRDVGVYRITDSGRSAVADFERHIEALGKLRREPAAPAGVPVLRPAKAPS